MNFSSLPAFFSRAWESGIGVFGGAGFFSPPLQRRGVLQLALPTSSTAADGACGKGEQIARDCGRSTGCLCPGVGRAGVLQGRAGEFLGLTVGKDVGHWRWLLAVSFQLVLDLKVLTKVDVPPVGVKRQMRRSGAQDQAQ